MSRGYIVRLWNKLVVKAGGKLDIYGELNIKDGATVTGINTIPATGNADDVLTKTADGYAFKPLPTPPTVPNASTDTKGVVNQAAAVADAVGEAPTAAEFNALLSALRAAGILAAAASEQETGDGADT